MDDPVLTIEDIEALARRSLERAGATPTAATSVARSVAAAERDGIASHGLAFVPIYCAHLECGKVNPVAQPKSAVRGSVVSVGADTGFAHPAIDLGFAELVPLAEQQGAAVLALMNSYNCGVLGYHTEALAARGLAALGYTNAPASIAPWGGTQAALGTNPFSVAAPDGKGGAAFVVDQSASVVAKSEVMKRRRLGETLPLGWALDSSGEATTDPEAAMRGTMVPAGGYNSPLTKSGVSDSV